MLYRRKGCAMRVVSFTRARAALSDLFSRVVTGGDRVIIERHGHERVAMVSMDDVAALERAEDQADIQAAEAALAEPSPDIPWEEIKRDLGL